ncbi:hypothetical protein FHS57_004231, partial [Runella defluvii]|nr:hypothetical protein [Runella defluvii]
MTKKEELVSELLSDFNIVAATYFPTF